MKRMKRFLAVYIVLIFFVQLLIKAVPARAQGILGVTEKPGVIFVLGETITTDMFSFNLDGEEITSNITITPNVLSQTGKQTISFTYLSGEKSYFSQIEVNVMELEAVNLTCENSYVRLVSGQDVSKNDLPEVTVTYNNGAEQKITDYNYEVDWDAKIITINYKTMSTILSIELIENTVTYIDVKCKYSSVSENYVVDKSDLIVTAYYLNKKSEQITDYLILPYKLEYGRDTEITITYQGVSGSFVLFTDSKVTTPEPTIEITTATPEINQPNMPRLDTIPDTTTPSSTASVNVTLDFKGGTYNNYMSWDYKVAPGATISLMNKSEILRDGFELETVTCVYGSVYISTDGTIVYISPENEIIDTIVCVWKEIDVNQNVSSSTVQDDKKKPTTNIKNKTYCQNLKITFEDTSGIKSARLTGAVNKTISSGYILKKEGKYKLTITDNAGNKKVVSFAIVKPATGLKISYVIMNSWNKVKFSAVVKGTTRSVTWNTTNKKVATISSKGILKAKSTGTCYVKCKIDKLVVKKKIKVFKEQKYIIVY